MEVGAHVLADTDALLVHLAKANGDVVAQLDEQIEVQSAERKLLEAASELLAESRAVLRLPLPALISCSLGGEPGNRLGCRGELGGAGLLGGVQVGLATGCQVAEHMLVEG